MDLVTEILEKHFLLTFEGNSYSEYYSITGIGGSGFFIQRVLIETKKEILDILPRLNQSEKLIFIEGLNREIVSPKFRFKKDKLFHKDFLPYYKEYRIFILSLKNVVQLENERNVKPNQISQIEVEVIPESIQQKICWLYAIGIIDYIKDKNKLNIQSPTTIGKILALGTGIKWDTIKKTIERIEENNLLDKYSSFINSECLRLKIKRLK